MLSISKLFFRRTSQTSYVIENFLLVSKYNARICVPQRSRENSISASVLPITFHKMLGFAHTEGGGLRFKHERRFAKTPKQAPHQRHHALRVEIAELARMRSRDKALCTSPWTRSIQAVSNMENAIVSSQQQGESSVSRRAMTSGRSSENQLAFPVLLLLRKGSSPQPKLITHPWDSALNTAVLPDRPGASERTLASSDIRSPPQPRSASFG